MTNPQFKEPYELFGVDDIAGLNDLEVSSNDSKYEWLTILAKYIDMMPFIWHTGPSGPLESLVEAMKIKDKSLDAAHYRRLALALIEVQMLYKDQDIKIALFKDNLHCADFGRPESGILFSQEVKGISYLFWHPRSNFQVKNPKAISHGKTTS